MDRAVRGMNTGRDKFFSSPKRSDRLCGSPSLLYKGKRHFIPGVKRAGREIDHSPTSSAEIKNGWTYASSPSICLHCMDKDNRPFLLLHSSF